MSIAEPATAATPPLRASAESAAFVRRLRELAFSGLRQMYVPEDRLFAFRVRPGPGGLVREGRSPRYTAITLIGLAEEPREAVSAVLAGHSPHEVVRRLIETACQSRNVGDVALALWAAVATGHPDAGVPRDQLSALEPDRLPRPTVELSWALAALTIEDNAAGRALRDRLARRLMDAFQDSHLFPHVIGGRGLRAHVCCFADIVYPIQALARYGQATGQGDAVGVARLAAERAVALQGAAGQWPWHFDVRSGRVVETYPVYAVHQDAMAPMAFHALEEAGGGSFSDAVARGLGWLLRSPELAGGSLVNEPAGVVWRKVARREPGKLARSLQALASATHRSLRVPGLDLLLPPSRIDREDRPYHLGWLLHAWPPRRLALPTRSSG